MTKKTKKINSTTVSKEISSKGTSADKKTNVKSRKKKNGAVHLLFSLGGFVLIVGLLASMFVPMMAHAKQGIYIIEPFTCEVALADYKHLTKTTKENNPKFVQEQLEVSLEAVTQELAEHAECKGVSDGK